MTQDEIKSGIFYLNKNFQDYFIEEGILGEVLYYHIFNSFKGTVGIVKKVRSNKNNKIYACKIVKTRDDETIFNAIFFYE